MTPVPKRPGRPTLSLRQRRSCLLGVRLTREEMDQLYQITSHRSVDQDASKFVRAYIQRVISASSSLLR